MEPRTIHPAADEPPEADPSPAAGEPRDQPRRTGRQTRLEREAAALRANLRKRKDQARSRDKPRQD
jgi:hypothetical protein